MKAGMPTSKLFIWRKIERMFQDQIMDQIQIGQKPS